MAHQCLFLVTPEFLRVLLCYSSKASAASSHSFLCHSQGLLPGRESKRRKSTGSWRQRCPSSVETVTKQWPDSPTPRLTHRARSNMNKHFSFSSAAAGREQLKEPSSCKAHAHSGEQPPLDTRHLPPPPPPPPRLTCQRWDAGSQQALGERVPRGKHRAGSAVKQGCPPAQRAAPAIRRAGQ